MKLILLKSMVCKLSFDISFMILDPEMNVLRILIPYQSLKKLLLFLFYFLSLILFCNFLIFYQFFTRI